MIGSVMGVKGVRGLRVLHVAAEAHPLIKTGGLADVAAALPSALRASGVDARLLLPGYPSVLAAVDPNTPAVVIGPAFGAAQVTLLRGRLPGTELPLYVIDAPWLYQRDGNPYVDSTGEAWADNAQRFGLLGWVAAQLAAGGLDRTWQPAVVHAHDWHAGLAPVYLRAHPASVVKTVITIHNLAFQGRFALAAAAGLQLPLTALTPQSAEFHGDLSFMKGALMSADHITTVSPTYAREILTPARGEGLDGVLRARSSVLTGILNGVDTNEWNPATDPLIAHCFDAERLDARALNKAALRRELGLTKTSGPLLAVVSRLTAQKGLDLLLAAIPNAIQRGAQLVVLGSGEPALEAAFKALGANHPVHVAVRLGFDEALAHRIFAGADAIVIPSQFEPCGLTQLYGLRYGAVPIVHRVGGLADTVTDAATHSSAAPGTGLVFEEPTAESLSHALQRALALFDQPRRWQALVRAGMNTPVDWDRAAKAYSTLYTGAVAQR